METERFAELMSELKERSGRSYGTLAKRLHSSNSTLHRYCNGAAVPQDFAPVERFAKVCGATADELLVLHGQWHRALTERRRAATPEAASGAGVAPGPEGTPGPEATPGPEVAPGPVAAPGPGAAEVSTAAAAGAAPESAGPGEHEHEPAPAEGETPAAEEKPGPWAGRRRWLLLAAASAVVVAATAGAFAVASALGGASAGQNSAEVRHDTVRPASREGVPLGAGAAPGAAPGASYGASPSVTPSPSLSATPSPPTSVPPTGSASPGTAKEEAKSKAKAKAGKGDSPADGATPFTVSVMPDNWGSPCDQWFALDQVPGRVPPPPARSATTGWAGALQAVPAGHQRLQVTVQGTGSGTTVLHGMSVHVVGSQKSPRWNAYTMGAGCGGELDPASFAVDLDNPSPRPKPVPGKEGERPTTTTDFPYKVSADDPQVLNVDAYTVGRDVSWYLELSWSNGGQQKTSVIDDHGRPFRTVALNTEQRYWYNANTNAWLPFT